MKLETYPYHEKLENGFTIIELIISILILSIAVVGIFSAFSIVTILTSDSADRFTGTYLAQEGMEIVRNIRDTNWLNMDKANCDCTPGVNCVAPDTCAYTWVDGLTSVGACSSTGCEADYTSISMSPYVAGSYLYLNANGFYRYAAGTKTKFERKIIITPVTDVDGNSSHIIKVIVQVSWDEKATILNSGVSADTCGTYNCITAEGTLYDWYNYVNH